MAENRIDFEAAVERKCEAFAKTILSSYAVQMEQYAKKEAEWKDHTHDARKGLRGDVYYRPGVDMGIILAHTVEYGKYLERTKDGRYLETANDGKYAILKPTVEHFMPDIKAELVKAFGGAR
jgi:hypothetical protein